MSNKTVLLFAFLLGISTVASGEVTFHNAKSEAWKQEVSATIEKVNQMLPSDWPRPENYHIVYSVGADDSYYPIFRGGAQKNQPPVHKLLVLGSKSTPATFVHEYGHLVMDVLLREKAPEWRYALTWQLVNFGDVEKSLKDYVDLLKRVKTINQEYVEKAKTKELNDMEKSVLTNSGKTITQTKELIIKLQEAITIQMAYDYPLTEFVSIKALAGMLELFSDTLAVAYFDSWTLMRDNLVETITIDQVRPFLNPNVPEEEALEMYVNGRNFPENLTLENYVYEPWMETNPYFRFGPTRSYLRYLQDQVGTTDQDLIGALGQGIINVYQKQLMPNPENNDRPLPEKNQALMTEVDSILAGETTEHAAN